MLILCLVLENERRDLSQGTPPQQRHMFEEGPEREMRGVAEYSLTLGLGHVYLYRYNNLLQARLGARKVVTLIARVRFSEI